ncbi:MAG: Rz1-like lysis system protein LysC [Tepidisphaeraceae bacterium]
MPETVVVEKPPKRIAVLPPQSLLGNCRSSDFVGSKNEDLLVHIDDLIAALGDCNADKAALRKWLDDNKHLTDVQ